MAVKVFLYIKLTPKLKKENDQFEIEHFMEDRETLENHSAHQKEKYYSKPSGWLLARDKNQIVGRVILFKRYVQFVNSSILLGGIGGVCTNKEMRRKGIASLILEKAMEVLTDWDCDIAYLCTDIKNLSSLYSKFGFVPLGRPYRFKGKSGKIYKKDDGMIAPVNSTAIFKKVLNSTEFLDLGNGNW